jgi:hypothetical protein
VRDRIGSVVMTVGVAIVLAALAAFGVSLTRAAPPAPASVTRAPATAPPPATVPPASPPTSAPALQYHYPDVP